MLFPSLMQAHNPTFHDLLFDFLQSWWTENCAIFMSVNYLHRVFRWTKKVGSTAKPSNHSQNMNNSDHIVDTWFKFCFKKNNKLTLFLVPAFFAFRFRGPWMAVITTFHGVKALRLLKLIPFQATNLWIIQLNCVLPTKQASSVTFEQFDVKTATNII